MFKQLKSATSGTHKRSFRILTAVITVLFVCSVTVTAFAAANANITVDVVDGENTVTLTVKTTDPREIVKLAGLKLGADDRLILDGFTADGGKIVIDRAKIIRIEDNGLIGYFVGYSDTLGDVLSNKGIVINEGDEINANATQPIYDGMNISITRAFGVGLSYENNAVMVSIIGGTVADALDKAGVKLNEGDVVTPSLDTELTGFTDIVVKRASFKQATETEEIDYKTEKIADPDMYVGETKVVTEGVKGEKVYYYTEKYLDGVYDSKVLDEEVVTKEPVTEVLHYGTKPVETLAAYKNSDAPISELEEPESLVLDENGVPVDYAYAIEGKATAYTGDPATSTGRTPMPGHIAVDPNEIPYGTELYVVSADGSYVYGYCIAADTGGFVEMGNTDIDLYMDNEGMCYDWGNREVIIYVLN